LAITIPPCSAVSLRQLGYLSKPVRPEGDMGLKLMFNFAHFTSVKIRGWAEYIHLYSP